MTEFVHLRLHTEYSVGWGVVAVQMQVDALRHEELFANGSALILTAGRDRATPESGAIPSGVDKSPEGATELSPALQRWERETKDSSPGGTTEFSGIFKRYCGT